MRFEEYQRLKRQVDDDQKLKNDAIRAINCATINDQVNAKKLLAINCATINDQVNAKKLLACITDQKKGALELTDIAAICIRFGIFAGRNMQFAEIRKNASGSLFHAISENDNMELAEDVARIAQRRVAVLKLLAAQEGQKTPEAAERDVHSDGKAEV